MAYTILEQVKIRLRQYHMDDSEQVVFDVTEDNPILEQLIEEATTEVKSRRMYPDSYTDEQVTEDLAKYESVIVKLTVYDRSQAGESYMSSYTENGVTRSWIDREKLLSTVYPFVKVLS